MKFVGPLSYTHAPHSEVLGILADPKELAGVAPLLDGAVSTLARMNGITGASVRVDFQQQPRTVVPFLLSRAMSTHPAASTREREKTAQRLAPALRAEVASESVAALTFTTTGHASGEFVRNKGLYLIKLAQQTAREYAEEPQIDFMSLHSQN